MVGKHPTIVIFKQKRYPGSKNLQEMIVNSNQMDGLIIKHERIDLWSMEKKRGLFFNTSSLVIIDSPRPHITENAKAKINSFII